MKTLLSVLVCALLANIASAATVLHIKMEYPIPQNNPAIVQPHVTWIIERTGLSALTGDSNPTFNIKNGLGLYKTPSALNAEMEAGVLDYLDVNHSITTFDAIYIQGGFTGLIL